jgi:hypothetical protein
MDNVVPRKEESDADALVDAPDEKGSHVERVIGSPDEMAARLEERNRFWRLVGDVWYVVRETILGPGWGPWLRMILTVLVIAGIWYFLRI